MPTLGESGSIASHSGSRKKIINTLIDGLQIPSAAAAATAPETSGNAVHYFQRIGSICSAHAGRDFEEMARAFFAKSSVELKSDFSVPVGYDVKRSHKFDLGAMIRRSS